MRILLRTVVAAALALSATAIPLAATAAPATTGADVVISQIYGGGGNQGGVYAHDFVELFNRSASPVSVDGWSIQYTSASGTNALGSTISTRTALRGTLAPGQYLLVRGGNGETAGLDALPTPDVDPGPSGINLHQNAGRVALVRGTESLGCNSAATCSSQQLARIVDLVGYGAASFYEGSAPTAALTNPSAAHRLGAGCTDRDDNATDLTVGRPAPRTSTTTLNPCVVAAPAPTTPTTPTAPVDDPVAPDAQPGASTAPADDPVAPDAEPGTPTEQPASTPAEEPGTPTEVPGTPTEQPAVTDAPLEQALVPTTPVVVEPAPAPACTVPILQPVNCDGSSIFKLGSTVPIRFELPNHGQATFTAVHVSSSVLGTEVEGTPLTLTATDGNAFRYAGGAYHYNWSTRAKDVKAGTYRVSIQVPGEPVHTVRISLRP